MFLKPKFRGEVQCNTKPYRSSEHTFVTNDMKHGYTENYYRHIFQTL